MKIVLVTGGSRGIGAETSKLFAKNGYTVIVNYNKSGDLAKKLCEEINNDGGDAHLYKADLQNQNEIEMMFDYIAKYFKKLDVLVNNAGVCFEGTIDSLSIDDAKKTFEINAISPYICCKCAFKLLKKSLNPCVVNVSSIWGIHGASCEVAYSMSKHAVVGLTKSLAKEWSFVPINVNCVCPPFVLTQMTKCYSAEEAEAFCKETGTHVYEPLEVANDIFKLVESNKTGVILEEK